VARPGDDAPAQFDAAPAVDASAASDAAGTRVESGAADGGGAVDATPLTQDDTWSDGKTIDGSIIIASGTTITIAPGAKIAIGAGATIIVQGTLIGGGGANGSHAALGDGAHTWGGIVVAGDGAAVLDGVDLLGAGMIVQAANAAARIDHATIDGLDPSAGISPFTVDRGGQLSTAHAVVRNAGDRSTINGTFTASYLDYDRKDSRAIYAGDPSAIVSIEDSTFHSSGTRPVGTAADVLNAYGAKSFHVAYTDITEAHCGFHFESPANTFIDIDHVTVHGVTNGADLWGSGQGGKKSIASSNFIDAVEGLDVQGGYNGAITVSGCYFGASLTNPGFPNNEVTLASPASAPIPDAHPR
jgi:hypothetical protein